MESSGKFGASVFAPGVMDVPFLHPTHGRGRRKLPARGAPVPGRKIDVVMTEVGPDFVAAGPVPPGETRQMRRHRERLEAKAQRAARNLWAQKQKPQGRPL